MAKRHKLSDRGTGIYDLVVVRNVGKKTVTLRHKAMGDVDVEPGKQRTIPVGIALVNLGNPATTDSGRRRDRTMEFEQVQRKWGFNRGFFSEDAWMGVGRDTITGEPVGPYCPTIECYDLAGERMFFVHDDPDGRRNIRDLSALSEAASDDRFVGAKIEDLQAQIVQLQDLMQAKAEAGQDPGASTSVVAESATRDIPLAALEQLGITPEQLAEALAHVAAHPDPDTTIITGEGDTTVLVGTGDGIGSDAHDQTTAQIQAERNELRDQIPPPPPAEPPLKKDAAASPRIGGGKSK